MPRSKLLKPFLVSVTLLAGNASAFAAGAHGGGGGGGHGGGGHASGGASHSSGGGASHYSGGGGGGVHYAGGQSYGSVGRGGTYGGATQHSAAPAHYSAPTHYSPNNGVMRSVAPSAAVHAAPSGLASHQSYNLSQSAPRSAGVNAPAANFGGNRVAPGNSPAYRAYGSLNAANTGAGPGPATNFGLASGNRAVTNVNVNVNNAGGGSRYGLGSQAYGGSGFVRPVGYGGYSTPYGGRNYGGYGGYGGYFSPYGFGLSIGFGGFGGYGGYGSPFGYGGYGGFGYGGLGGFGGYNRYGYGGYGGGYGGFSGVGYGGSYGGGYGVASPIFVPAPVTVLSDFVPVPTVPAPVVDQSVIPPAADEPAPAPVGFATQGDRLVRAGKYEEAARAYRHAAVDDPQNGTLAVRASQALTAAGKYDEAAGAAQQGFALIDPKDWLTEAKNSANVFGDPQAATAAYAALLKASADAKAGPGVKFLSGIAAAGRGDYARAAGDLDAVTKLVPQDTVAAQWKTIVDAKK